MDADLGHQGNRAVVLFSQLLSKTWAWLEASPNSLGLCKVNRDTGGTGFGGESRLLKVCHSDI